MVTENLDAQEGKQSSENKLQKGCAESKSEATQRALVQFPIGSSVTDHKTRDFLAHASQGREIAMCTTDICYVAANLL